MFEPLSFPVTDRRGTLRSRPPDITYVPLHDAPPIEWGAFWLETNAPERVRAFVEAASDARAGPALS